MARKSRFLPLRILCFLGESDPRSARAEAVEPQFPMFDWASKIVLPLEQFCARFWSLWRQRVFKNCSTSSFKKQDLLKSLFFVFWFRFG